MKTRLATLALASTLVACGPVWMIPGGALSGNERPPPSDWSSVDTEETIQLETRPSSPYSVNVWGTAAGSSYYIAAGRGGESTWAQHIAEDSDVRLRLGDNVYALRAVRVEDEAELDVFLAAMQKKYDFEPTPEQRAEAWLFRLDPR